MRADADAAVKGAAGAVGQLVVVPGCSVEKTMHTVPAASAAVYVMCVHTCECACACACVCVGTHKFVRERKTACNA